MRRCPVLSGCPVVSCRALVPFQQFRTDHAVFYAAGLFFRRTGYIHPARMHRCPFVPDTGKNRPCAGIFPYSHRMCIYAFGLGNFVLLRQLGVFCRRRRPPLYRNLTVPAVAAQTLSVAMTQSGETDGENQNRAKESRTAAKNASSRGISRLLCGFISLCGI